jgi:hypothetical protein
MSLDAIKHAEDAIHYFNHLSDEHFSNHSTIYIFGLMQAFIIQQDAIYSLHQLFYPQKNIIRKTKKLNIYEVNKAFTIARYKNDYTYIELIRWHRNNLVGHPVNKEIYINDDRNTLDALHFPEKQNKEELSFFLSLKSEKEKNNVSYVCYKPNFEKITITLLELIDHQHEFASNFTEKLLDHVIQAEHNI